ncbi:LytR C-terminal domain-containing protein [Streptomyces sp. NPDC046866]|uniref:LytR C-terminal domain-containing protein n=1 Tax=Streptomyces sp. NPDC046866 TaxID=3154921 RepID=UPI003456313D
MSMLTPPGMGGKYRVTGAAYPRMSRPRRRRRIVFTLLGAVLGLAVLGYGSLQLIHVFRGEGGSGKQSGAMAAKHCPSARPKAGAAPAGVTAASAAAVPLPQPGDITVNVYNATARAGLAKAVGDELKKRGFAVGHVGNAPADLDKKVPGTGLLVGSAKTDKAAYAVLSTQIEGDAQQNDAREGADIDLILGDAFKDLSPKEAADKELALLAHPQPTPAASC